MSRNQTFLNADGLTIGFGTHSADNDIVAVNAEGNTKIYQVEITGVDLVDTFALTDIKPQDTRIPRGSIIKSASLQVITAFTSAGAPTLDLGLFGTAVVDDADGIDAAIALAAIDAVGEIVICNGALVGGTVPVGATADTDVFIAPSRNVTTYTAGVAILKVEVVLPDGSSGGSLAA